MILPCKRDGRRGSTILEPALVLPAFLFMLIGTLDIGRLMFMHQTLTERARNAVRWGATHTYSETNIRNKFLYNTSTPADGARAMFGLGTSNVVVSRTVGASGAPDRLTLRITGWSYRFLSPHLARSVVAPDIITAMTMENP
jgi:Flp pilus assembly protein TadG